MSGRKLAVIGAGFGGISLAVRLQAAGHQVTLIEGREKPGGRAYVWEDEGFTFDAGPTVVTDPDCLEEVFAAAGRKLADYVELMPVTPFYDLRWDDGARFAYVNDQAELDRQIMAMSPGDVEGYRRFHEFSEAVYQEGYVKLGHVPFLTIGSMLASARLASTPFGGHSSNAITMSLPSRRWISIERSGVSMCREPSRWLLNDTPSSLCLVSADRLIT